MLSFAEAERRLSALPSLQVTRNEPLARHTRFALGGPATLFADTTDEDAFVEALRLLHSAALPWLVIGLGSNLIAADRGFRGVVLRYRGARIETSGQTIRAQSGVPLQDVVDLSTAHGLQGMETLTGIPGNLGAAIYGNAGAYGSSLSDVVRQVRYFDGQQIRCADHAACQFRYRGSIFKQLRLAGKAWLILSAELTLQPGDSARLQARAAEILETRNRKYPPEMRCAGSIFKNLILADLPPPARNAVPASIVKGGKVPSAWFLEATGAKGLANGGVHVTSYHANTLYNAGNGTAAQFLELTAELKRRVQSQYALTLEEEVQTVGFDQRPPGLDHLETTPFAIQALLAGLSPDELHACPGPERPSAAQILALLAHAEIHSFQPRLHQRPQPPAPDSTLPLFALATLEEFLQARRSTLAALENNAATPCPQLLHEWAAHDLTLIALLADTVRAVKYYSRAGTNPPHSEVQP